MLFFLTHWTQNLSFYCTFARVVRFFEKTIDQKLKLKWLCLVGQAIYDISYKSFLAIKSDVLFRGLWLKVLRKMRNRTTLTCITPHMSFIFGKCLKFESESLTCETKYYTLVPKYHYDNIIVYR